MGAAVAARGGVLGARLVARHLGGRRRHRRTISQRRRRRRGIAMGRHRGGHRRRPALIPAAGSRSGQRIVFAPGAANMSAIGTTNCVDPRAFSLCGARGHRRDAPRWMTEGVADFVARPSAAVPAEARSAYQPLPSDIDLDTPGPQRSMAYDRAWWFARFVADTYGTPQVACLLSGRLPGRTPRPADRRPRRPRRRPAGPARRWTTVDGRRGLTRPLAVARLGGAPTSDHCMVCIVARLA